MSRFCKDCQFWLFAYVSIGERFGTCDHPMVEAKVIIDREREEEYVIHTESTFGCMYHTPVHGNVATKINEDE
jgi:hypothetical protein